MAKESGRKLCGSARRSNTHAGERRGNEECLFDGESNCRRKGARREGGRGFERGGAGRMRRSGVAMGEGGRGNPLTASTLSRLPSHLIPMPPATHGTLADNGHYRS
jgi:hypothetical protein